MTLYKVECNPDVALVVSLTSVSKRNVMHHNGKTEILRKLLRGRDFVGVIDRDPASIQPIHFFQYFQRVSLSENDGIEVMHHRAGHNRLIIIYPRLEEWIIESARRINVQLQDYNLSSHGNELKAEINHKINRFEELLDDLKVSSPRLRALRTRLIEPF